MKKLGGESISSCSRRASSPYSTVIRRANSPATRIYGALIRHRKFTWALALLLAMLGGRAWCAPPATQPAAVWLNTMPDAYQDAQGKGRPIFVLVGASWCEPCKRLDQELQKPGVPQKLSAWTCVHLDSDKTQDVPQMLVVSAIPALRVVDTSGKVVASRDGFVEADDLLVWLKENSAQAAAAAADPDLVGGGELDAEAVGRLIKRLGDSNAAVRQACERRLRDAANTAGPPVVDAFAQGKLAVRLSALAVLQAWKAPVDGLDPWQPETITPARIEQLKTWAAAAKTGARSQTLDATELVAARAELDRMAAMTAPDAAEAVCCRLANYGPGLLPEVRARLAAATTDAARQRLTELRYRLAATDARLLRWANGWLRLASGEVKIRRAAAGELIASAKSEDAPLLLELFSDPDPVLREMSLGALQRVSGASASGALMQLLHDPEPNVRAAVLKQLADKPSPALAPALIEYVTNEKDVDLICHAVRALREIKTPESVHGLFPLLKHPAWRVRGETADALIEAARRSQGPLENEIYAALIKLLDDPDNFVVGRAVTALKRSGQSGALEPLIRAMERHPEMAGDIIESLVDIGNESSLKPRVLEELRKLCGHTDPHVRSAALAGMVSIAPEGADASLLAGLKDSVAEVRLAAAQGVFQVIEHDRAGSGRSSSVSVQQFAAFHDTHAANTWFAKAIPALQGMLSKDVDAKNLTVALPLTALGYDDSTMPLLLAAAQKADLRGKAVASLPYLPWERRAEMYAALMAHHGKHKDVEQILTRMVQVADPQALAKVWELLDDPATTPDDVNMVLTASRQFYWGYTYYYENEVPAAVVRKVVEDFSPRTEAGAELKRTAALVLVAEVSPVDAVPLARKIMDDPASTQWNKLDAFQVLLASLPPAEAQKAAAEAFEWTPNFWYKVYVPYLALGAEGIQNAHGSIGLAHAQQRSYDYSSGTPIVVTPPAGLKAEGLKALRPSVDASFVPMVDYLLCLCGDASGFAPLAADWRSHHQQEDNWTSMVYRAAAVLNDDSLTPTLEEIYHSFPDKTNSWPLKKFYWTIRTMTGPKVMELRKQMRDEVGMNNLR